MNKLRCIVAIISVLFFAVSSTSAQKNVKRILDYYESGAYHLTIKNINNLKAEHQSKGRMQLLLADAYWQIGNKKRSTEIYEDLAVANKIPVDFQEKYEQAMLEKSIFASLALESFSAEHFEIPSVPQRTKGNIVQPVYTARKSIAKLKLLSQKVRIQAVPIQAKPIEVKSIVVSPIKPSNIPTTPAISLANVPPIETKRINEKRPLVTSLVNGQENKSVGRYRIRIGVATNEEVTNLVRYLGSTEVATFEWAQKKIVIIGFYDSPKIAQAFIDQYLKHFYSKAVVVTKEGGRYKSVNQAL